MGFRVYFAVGILLLIVATGLFVRQNTYEICRQCVALLEQAEGQIKSKNALQAQSSFNSSFKLWSQSQNFLTLFTVHDRLDEVTLSYSRTTSLWEDENYADISSEINSLYFLISIVAQYDSLGIRNIF